MAMKDLLYRGMIAHAFCFIITFYREVYEAKLMFTGQFMRAMEVFAVVFYFEIVFAGMRYYSQWTLKDDVGLDDILARTVHGLKDKDQLRLFREVLAPTCFNKEKLDIISLILGS